MIKIKKYQIEDYISDATQDALDLKADLVDGKVPASQLPSFVDDVIEVANYAALPIPGASGVIYITLDTNKVYRWSGSVYVEIASGVTNLSYTPGVSNGTVNSDTGSDATIPLAGTVNAGLFSAAEKSKLEGIAPNANVGVIPNTPITGATKTKITYDTKGLVTVGADATTADIADSTNKRYVTDANLTVINNTSGTNTGDQDLQSVLENGDTAYDQGIHLITDDIPSNILTLDVFTSDGGFKAIKVDYNTTTDTGSTAVQFTSNGASNIDEMSTGITLQSNNTANGNAIEAYSLNGKSIVTYGEGTVAIESNLGTSNKGLVINSGTSSTGNFIELAKNSVNKLVVNQQGELTAQKLIKEGGTSSQFLMADGSVTIGNGGVYSYEIHVSQVDGNDTTGTGAVLNPVASITKALTLVGSQRKTIIIHPGNYTESPSITVQYTVLTTYQATGGNTLITGTVSTSTGCSISGLKMTNLNIDAPTGTGNVNILNCDISGTLTRTNTGTYTLIRFCDIGITNINSTSGTVAIFGGNPGFITVNNAGASVLVKNAVCISPVVLVGNATFADCILIPTGPTTNALTSSAGTFITLANSQCVIPTFQNVARVSLSGFYSILNCVFDKPNSTLVALSGTGGSTNSIVYSQFINADKFIKQGGLSTEFLKADGSVSTAPTNLTTSQTASNFTINSDTGTDASVPLGDGTLAGATLNNYTTTEKNKLAAITGTNTGDQNLQQVTDLGASTTNPITSNSFVKSGGTSSQILAADGSVITAGTNITITGGQISSIGGSGGGGSSVNYYLNGGTSQGTFGGTTYYEFSKTAVIGTGADFSRGTNGYIASFITDVADPSLLLIPAGNWNLEFFFSASSNGGSPSFYVELYKYDGTTFTSIASSSATPEGITNGTAIDAYFTPLAVPETVLTVNDRLAIRVFVNASSKTITLHTQNGHLCEVITTFTSGLTALNGLQAQVQNFATGTTGTDFAINSSGSTHTFNLPSASATARGVVTTGGQTFAGTKTFSSNIVIPATGSALILSASSGGTVSGLTTTTYPDLTELAYVKGVTSAIQTQLNGKVTSVTGTAPVVSSGGTTPAISMAAATASVNGYLTSANWTTFNNKQDKSLSAYTIMANNTASTADATAQNFRSVAQQSYTNTITWTGTAPTSGTNSYSWIRIGNMVTVRLNLVYSVAGSGITAASCPLPSDCPTPLVPSGLGSAGHVLYYGSGNLQAIGTVPATPVAVVACLRLNLGGGGYDLYIQRSSGGHSVGYITVTYFTS